MAQLRRVLMSMDSVGGVFSYALDLTREFGKRGIEVIALNLGRSLEDPQRREADALSNLVLHDAPYKLEWMENPWSEVWQAGKILMELERRYAPDVVHLNGYSHAALPFRAPVLSVAHSCVRSWWQAVHGDAAPSVYDAYADHVTRGLRSADAVIAVSHAMRESLRAHYGLQRPVRVILNGCDPERLEQGAKEPVVLAAGRVWDAAKNMRALTRIAPELSWPLAIAGDASCPHASAAGIAMDEAPNVRWLGALSRREMAASLGRAALYVSMARYEPFGLAVLEAAFSRCALVLSDIPTFRELWEGAAWFVPQDDPRALTCALQRLIETPELRDEWALRAQERARQYTLARTASAYLELYRDLMARPRRVGEMSAKDRAS